METQEQSIISRPVIRKKTGGRAGGSPWEVGAAHEHSAIFCQIYIAQGSKTPQEKKLV